MPPELEAAVRRLEALVPGKGSAAAFDDLAAALAPFVRARASDDPPRPSSAARLREGLPDEPIIGDSGGLTHVMERVDMVARQDVPVLLLGETGSGKEVIARAVHTRSGRAAGPFVRVNCGAIPRDLIDSELFGHEKGSFTGATDRRRGWFERADSGTLLLDEIGELPLDAQVRLLRILQDGTFNRLGGHEPISVNVRIVAATHRDLPAMVDRQAFREDLWYRIATFPIRIPPLRERTPDIAELARHFIRKAAVRFGLPEPGLDERSLQLLESYPWPGNIRELGAVIDRAVILSNGGRLDVAPALGLALRGPVPMEATAEPLGPGGIVVPPRPAAASAPSETLEDAMRRHIGDALARSRACLALAFSRRVMPTSSSGSSIIE